LPPDTAGSAIAASAICDLNVCPRRAFMNTRLTALEKETLVETIEEQIETLSRMTVRQLHQRHLELFGEPTRSNHRQFLFRRIAWRIQALAEGGLSERARRRAMEIANDADLRIRAPRMLFGKDFTLDRKASESRRVSGQQDPRLPPPGSFLEREFRGHRIIVKIRPDGFEFEGRPYRSLSAIAREVTGTKWNGFTFFGLPASAPRGTHGEE
jgi:hypothetical protein